MKQKVEKVKLPYSVANILKTTQTLCENNLIRRFISKQLSDKDALRLTELLRWKIDASIPFELYAEVVDTVKRQTLTEEKLKRLLWCLVSLRSGMKQGKHAIVSDTFREDTWIPVRVVNVTALSERNNWQLKCQALATVLAGTDFDYRISLLQALRIAYRSGFNQRDEQSKLITGYQLYGLRILVLADSKSAAGRVMIKDVGAYGAFITYNAFLIKSRRVERRTCPFQLSFPCHICNKGRDVCEQALRPVSEKFESYVSNEYS
jgi:hypothetical protein